VRVQLVTDENNLRSRAAIQKIGGIQEGIHRKERIKSDGNYRNTVMFSIIDDEWDSVKVVLTEMIEKRTK
jgi:RimJ/RimL family protein N-acetyltransferase